jgi:hypothetical protein
VDNQALLRQRGEAGHQRGESLIARFTTAVRDDEAPRVGRLFSAALGAARL